MNIKENVPLKEHTYYRIGGPARYFIEAESPKEVKKGLEFAEHKNLPVFVLGGGTNVLFPDGGFKGLALKIDVKNLSIKAKPAQNKHETKTTKQTQNKRNTEKEEEYHIVCGAGVKLGKVVKTALDNNLAGLEWAAGIPGTVGGAVRGNAGAFGGSMGDVVKSAEVIMPRKGHETEREHKKNTKPKDKKQKEHGSEQAPNYEASGQALEKGSVKFSDLSFVKFSVSEMGFGYRTSRVKKEQGVVLEATLGPFEQVGDKEIENIKNEAKEHIKYRKNHQPYDLPSCGSVFKGIIIGKGKLSESLQEFDKRGKLKFRNLKDRKIKIPAGWLIEKADLKGKEIGEAQISEKHANFIVNKGNAKASDIYRLIQLAKDKVKEEFGVQLECEVEIVGDIVTGNV